MSIHSENVPETAPSSCHRLATPFALRELIQGREFEINDGDYCEDDYNLCRDEFNPDEIMNYINFDAVDLDVDENDKVICFADLRKKMTPVTSDGRVLKRMKKQGLGEIIPNTGVVYYHYSAYANLQEEPFDNSYLRGNQKPQRLVLDKGQAIIGVELAIKTMKIGELSQFLIEPEYAFGKLGCPPRVPPEATILFEIEIIDFVEVSDTTETALVEIEHEETSAEKFKRLFKAAKENHVLGNDLFKRSNLKMAASRYRRGRDILLDAICQGEEDEKEKNHLLLKLFSNLAICYSRMKNPRQVCLTCKDAFYFNEEEAKKNQKLYFFWGCALMEFGDFDGAKNKLRAALKLEPNNADIKEAMKKLEDKRKQHYEESRSFSRRAFGFTNAAESTTKTDEEKSDVSEQIVSILKRKFDEAKKNGVAEMMLPSEVHDSIKDLCAELATRDLQFFKRGNKLIISKRS